MPLDWNGLRTDLGALVSIPSVAEQGSETAPYGESCAKALEWALSRAGQMGFEVKNVGGFAGHAEYGEGEEYCAVLVHLDVVPAGFGWSSPPFSLTERGGALYGRGTADNKGAAVAALHCLKALRDSGITGNRRIRVIFGCGEECGMEDMERYFSLEPLPIYAFTPDSEYPIGNREKGILQFRCAAAHKQDGDVLSFCAGAAVNAVPDFAQDDVLCTPQEAHRLEDLSQGYKATFEFTPKDGLLTVTAHGKGSHAMAPADGINAAAGLVELLHSVLGDRVGQTLSMLHSTVGLETDGASLGIACQDEPSGALTLNLSTVTISDLHSGFSGDIRFPVTTQGAPLLDTLQKRAATHGLDTTIIHLIPPVYLPEDTPLICMLRGAFESVTGERAELYSTGGGTYARTLSGRGAAFGPIFPHQSDPGMHKPDEHIDIKCFQLHCEICLEAMKRMFTAPDPEKGEKTI